MFEKKRSTRKKYRVSGFLLILCLLMSLLTAGCGSSPADSLTGESHIITSVQEAETEQTTETEQLAETEQLTEVEQTTEIEQTTESDPSAAVREDGQYTTRDEVALYIHLYGHLPDNYITKREAHDLGWDSRSGNLWDVADGKSIGGDKFGNYEGLCLRHRGGPGESAISDMKAAIAVQNGSFTPVTD